MTRRSATACLIGSLALCLGACGSGQNSLTARAQAAEASARQQRLSRQLVTKSPASARNTALARWIMPHELREISGLALVDDNHVLAHGDNVGEVSEIDIRRGELVKRFAIGDHNIHDDFEAIAIADSDVYMLSSTGGLYEFNMGADGQRVPYKMQDTHLGNRCEFEGLAFDPRAQSLVLACKTIYASELRDQLVLFRWPLHGPESGHVSTLSVPLNRVIGSNPWKSLHPSDITVDPRSGDYVLVASKEKALIEITPAGEVVRAQPLPGKHEQAEGVAITRDGVLLVSDEARKNTPAMITLYRWPLAPAEGIQP